MRYGNRGMWDPYEDKFATRHRFDLLLCIGLIDSIFSNRAIFIWDVRRRNWKK